jgi:glycosyltransferase involved in cell wall biosynthesis
VVIHFFVPGPPGAPSGGIRKLYDWAELLAGAGHEVHIIPTWTAADPDARVARPGKRDLLVIPEVYGDALASLYPDTPRISLNQNPYYSWQNTAGVHPYWHAPKLLDILTVSHHARAMLETFFDRSVSVISPCIDPFQGTERARFYFEAGDRRRRILYFDRKDARTTSPMLLGSLQGNLLGWSVVRLDGRPDHEIAELYRSSDIFLSFQRHEGFGSPAAEALASGCQVCGWSGGGGNDYSRDWSPQDDLTHFHNSVLIAMAQPGKGEYRQRVSDTILRNFSREKEVDAVLEYFKLRADEASS